jgi:DNA invertase Pin-like site-specific DNA recombinase
MSFTMKSFLGEMERRQVKYRTKKAMEYKKARAEVVGSIPYGYRRNGKSLVEDIMSRRLSLSSTAATVTAPVWWIL